MAFNGVNNYQASGLQVIMGDGPPLDLTKNIRTLRVGHDLATLEDALIWKGRLELSGNVLNGINESLDNEINPRWDKGAHPIRVYVDGHHLLTFRLKGDYTYNPNEKVAIVSLTDKLGLIDFDQPKKNLRSSFLDGSIPFKVQEDLSIPIQSWGGLIQKTLLLYSNVDGVQYFDASEIHTEGLPLTAAFPRNVAFNPPPDGYDNDPSEGDRNPVEISQNIAGPRGYLMWCDKNEHVQFTLYPLDNQASPVIRKTLHEMRQFTRETKPQLDNSDQPDSIAVSGSGLFKLKEKEAYPKVIIMPGGEVAPSRIETIERPTRKGLVDTTLITSRTQLRALFPNFYPIRSETNPDVIVDYGTGMVSSGYKEKISIFDEEGYPIEATESWEECKGVISPATFPGDSARQLGRRIVEMWFYDSKKRLIEYKYMVYRPAYAVFEGLELFEDSGTPLSQALVFDNGTVEKWIELGFENFRHERIEFRAAGLLADPIFYDVTPQVVISPNTDNQVQFVKAPPNPPFREPLEPVEPKVFQENISIRNGADGAPARSLPINSKWINSPETASSYGQTLATMQERDRIQWQCTHVIHPEIETNYKPCRIAHIGSKKLVMDGVNYIYQGGDSSQMVMNYVGKKMGDLVTPVELPERPFMAVSNDLAVVEIPDYTGNFSFNTNVNQTISLSAQGGASPYSYGASGLPPGMTLVNDQIVGAPTTEGSYTVTVTVTDNLLANANWNFTLDVIPPPVSVPHFELQMGILARSMGSGRIPNVYLPRIESELSKHGIGRVPKLADIENQLVAFAYADQIITQDVDEVIAATAIAIAVGNLEDVNAATSYAIQVGLPGWKEVTQYSIYNGLVATVENLQDGDVATGGALNNVSNNWLKIEFEGPLFVSSVRVSGGFLPGFANTAGFLEGTIVQTSLNNVDWDDQVTITGLANSGINQTQSFLFSQPTITKYIRLLKNGYLGLGEIEINA